MARRHSGLGRGLDALIPMREEVEKAMQSAESEGVEILFTDDEDTQSSSSRDFFSKTFPRRQETEKQSAQERKNVSRETSPEIIVETPAKEVEKAQDQVEDVATAEVSAESSVDVPAVEPAEAVIENKNDPPAKDDLKDSITVRISEVEPNRDQPRKVFDEEKLEELAESIKTYGLLQPILVQKRDGYYEIIAGERRWRAALKAGLKEIPVIIREYSEKEILELSLIENIQREDLNPIEEAQAFKRLMDEFDMGQADVAQRVSKSRSAVANALRLLKLQEPVQKMVIDGKLSMGHARALLPLEIAEEQISVAEKIVDKQLSVRETEKLVKNIQNTASADKEKDKKSTEQEEDPSIAVIYKQIEERLQQTLHTKVAIQRKRNGHGKLLIDFYNSDDLEKIIDRLSDR